MLVQLFLAVITTASVAFLICFEVKLLRELKQRVVNVSLTEPLSRKKPPELHIHKLKTIHRQHSECSRKSFVVGDISCET